MSMSLRNPLSELNGSPTPRNDLSKGSSKRTSGIPRPGSKSSSPTTELLETGKATEKKPSKQPNSSKTREGAPARHRAQTRSTVVNPAMTSKSTAPKSSRKSPVLVVQKGPSEAEAEKMTQQVQALEKQIAEMGVERDEQGGILAQLVEAMTAASTREAELQGQVEFQHSERSRLEKLAQLKTDELEQQLQHTQTQLREQMATASAASAEKLRQVEQTLVAVEAKYKAELARTLEVHQEELSQVRGEREALQQRLERELAMAQRQIEAHQASIVELRAVEGELRTAQVTLGSTQAQCTDQQSVIAALQAQLAEKCAEVDACHSKIRDDEMTRRQLHETIQQLKGNIRVFCRVRPAQENEEKAQFEYDDESGSAEQRQLRVVCASENSFGKQIEKRSEFSFDRVFNESSTQADVFAEISQLVQSSLDGYNCCIFAYGQTGAGKTYTMEGPPAAVLARDPEQMGMIPRSVRQIFESARALEVKGWTYEISATFVEIYNEVVRDLLAEPEGNDTRRLEIRTARDGSGAVDVADAVVATVASEADVIELVGRAQKNRAVGATQCNMRSSRSHSVFRLRLRGSNAQTGKQCDGVLNLIDLAGSERLASSKSTGDRLRETQNINKSLSNLGTVIMALSNKASHVPYRNSKLTHLLQDSLGGNSKTLMFVNVAPAQSAVSESLCSLRFATTVNACNIGTAQQRVK